MQGRTRVFLSAQQRHEAWRRRQQGHSITKIAEALHKTTSTIFNSLASTGGFEPALQHRSPRVLSLVEREEISRSLCQGLSLRQIAQQLHRHPSTVSREVRRHGGARQYRACEADKRAYRWARRPKPCRLGLHRALRQTVVGKLRCNWSPQQICHWLVRQHAEDDTMRVSHETIYKTLFVQSRGALKKQLLRHLRSKRPMRLPRSAARAHASKIVDALSIAERPAQVQDRAVPGHWEGDLIIGKRGTQIGTLVERHSRYVLLIKLERKDTQTVVEALTKQALKLPRELRKSLTWDRGGEMANHKQFSLATDVQVYFCDPHSPWQRGSNENTNGLLRQYFPKGTLLSAHSQAYLDKVARELNERPRETLDYRSPAEVFNECVASTG